MSYLNWFEVTTLIVAVGFLLDTRWPLAIYLWRREIFYWNRKDKRRTFNSHPFSMTGNVTVFYHCVLHEIICRLCHWRFTSVLETYEEREAEGNRKNMRALTLAGPRPSTNLDFQRISYITAPRDIDCDSRLFWLDLKVISELKNRQVLARRGFWRNITAFMGYNVISKHANPLLKVLWAAMVTYLVLNTWFTPMAVYLKLESNELLRPAVEFMLLVFPFSLWFVLRFIRMYVFTRELAKPKPDFTFGKLRARNEALAHGVKVFRDQEKLSAFTTRYDLKKTFTDAEYSLTRLGIPILPFSATALHKLGELQASKTVVVLCPGRHHHALIMTPEQSKIQGQLLQGFLSSSGRFIARDVAGRRATLAGQLAIPGVSASDPHPYLFSEDLWI